jgi:hypothetical protein
MNHSTIFEALEQMAGRIQDDYAAKVGSATRSECLAYALGYVMSQFAAEIDKLPEANKLALLENINSCPRSFK